ncbi:MAG TPA: iron ABC transporter permease [Saprospiraceae bacterium]|nr:iron ABC transporter permease [Saprospiraceae bacterium]
MVKPIEIASYRQVKKTIQQRLYTAVFSVKGLAVVTMLVAIASLFQGAYALSPKEIFDCIMAQFGWSEVTVPAGVSYMLFQLRLPRIILGLLVWATLASSGAALQALFRNPLADPGLVGVTSGAMLFAVFGIVFTTHIALIYNTLFLNYFTLTIFAFTGSLLTTWLVYRLSTFGNRTYVATMLLAGVAMSALAGAITGLFTYFSNESQLRDITFWTLGSLGSAQWIFVIVLLPICCVLFFLIIRQAPALNLLLLGEQEAAYAGVNIQRLKKTVIICTALGVGACVAACGVIGFVGLVVPHLLRLVRGTNYRWLLPASALLGGALLVVADTIARTAIAPAELPIGVLTALLGSPFFLWLLLKSRGRMAIHF